ncbi:MAG: hypothetical protein MNPFHGCM_02791 [Gemmatimonadaceae bacterium]|nr:hypothetical protein [Gemmatimonadaceae bacterium]
MLRLRTFGGVLIEGSDGPISGPASQRRRLALLALLAASERGLTRDRLIAYLWPDSAEDRARHALAQLLYGLRRELGEEVIRGDAVTLRLNSSRLTSDIAEFRDAIARNELERAVQIYSGSFLEGFFLSGCPEFDRWVEDIRRDVAHEAHEVLIALATRCAERGDRTAEAGYLRRLSKLSPLDSRVVLSLMKALSAMGDRTTALELAANHQALVRSELDAAPDPQVEQFAMELRAMASHELNGGPPPRVQPDLVAGTTSAASTPNDGTSVSRKSGRTHREWWRRVAAYVLGLGTVAAIGAMATMRLAPAPNRTWVLIADAENATGDAVFDRTMPVALSAALAQSGRVYPVPPDRIQQTLAHMRRPAADSILNVTLAREVAQRVGVSVIVIPSVERSGNGFDLAARLIDPATGGVIALATARASGREHVVDVLGELGRNLRRELGESRFSVARSPVVLPSVTTNSLDALKKFADGGHAFNTSQYLEANTLWLQAVRIDSGFASAYASLGQLAYWTNRPSEGVTYYARALELAKHLPERERLRIEASAEGWRGNRAGAVRLLTPYLASHPGDLDLLRELAYHLLRASRFAEAEHTLLQVTALDTLDANAFLNLATAQKASGRYAEALVNYRRSFAIDRNPEVANNNVNLEVGGAYVLNGQLDSARATFDRLLASPDSLRKARAVRSLAFLDLYEGRIRSAAKRLEAAAETMHAAGAGLSEVRNRLLLTQALDMLDEKSQATLQLRRTFDVTVGIDAQVLVLLWVGKALARHGDLRSADSVLRLLRPRMQPDVPEDVAAYETLLGETLLARSRAREAVPHLRAGYGSKPDPHGLESLAYGLAVAGALDSAAARYAQLERMLVFGTEAQHPVRLAAYWLGRVEEARANGDSARAAYGRFVRQWKAIDHALPLVDDARARLSRLSLAPAGQ